MVQCFICLIGSPPRVRGLPDDEIERAVKAGITPACAGTTIGQTWKSSAKRDHPRVCGDY